MSQVSLWGHGNLFEVGALVGDLEETIFSKNVAVTVKQERLIGAVKIVVDIDSVLENVTENLKQTKIT